MPLRVMHRKKSRSQKYRISYGNGQGFNKEHLYQFLKSPSVFFAPVKDKIEGITQEPKKSAE